MENRGKNKSRTRKTAKARTVSDLAPRASRAGKIHGGDGINYLVAVTHATTSAANDDALATPAPTRPKKPPTRPT